MLYYRVIKGFPGIKKGELVYKDWINNNWFINSTNHINGKLVLNNNLVLDTEFFEPVTLFNQFAKLFFI